MKQHLNISISKGLMQLIHNVHKILRFFYATLLFKTYELPFMLVLNLIHVRRLLENLSTAILAIKLNCVPQEGYGFLMRAGYNAVQEFQVLLREEKKPS